MFLLFSIFQILINLLNSVFNSIVNPCGFDIRFLKNTLLLVTILYTCRLFYANKRLNLIESFWHGPCASLLPFVTIVLWFLFSLFLGFALHNIHTFHSRFFFFFFFIKLKIKRKRKRKQIVFCTIFLVLKTRLVNLFSHNMSFVPA